ncbi:restriction endonuclease subunit S [uncultured Roseobacter sp.]|uniref:restriction endonuclease subunit S n=1 Tax=uncultured Roseobacter sp. TaxID=114847 RepID=UPI00262BB1ED|nr:restriction endonuclease subunit S [uncultured Roseobacter sp.]
MTEKKSVRALPKLRFPEFADEPPWECPVLGKLAKRVTKRNSDGAELRALTNSAEHGVVDQKDFFDKVIAVKTDNYFVVEKGDYVYNPRVSTTAPVGPISKNLIGTGVMSPLYTVFRFRSETNDFFAHYFKSSHWHGYLQRVSNSGARHDRMAISNDDFMQMPIPTPTPREQQKIVDCLGSLDDLIAGQTQQLDALRRHKKGLVNQLFPQEGNTLPAVRFLQYQNSGDWISTTLGEVADYENGKAYEQDIVDDGRFVVVNARFISTNGAVEKFTNETYCIAQTGDVLMVLSDLPSAKALARCFLVDADEKYAVNQRIAKLRPHSVDSKFLMYVLDQHPLLVAFSDGINQTHLSKGAVLNCPLAIPRDNCEQKRIANCFSTLDAMLSAQTHRLEFLKTYKKGLLQSLFPSLGDQRL